MRNFIYTLTLVAILFSSCTREERRTAGQKEEPKTGAMLLAESKQMLVEAKSKLAQESKYGCCIKDPCDRCALYHQNCPCAEDVKAGKAVCPDCYAGWQSGVGIVKGVNTKKVKDTFP